MTSLKKITAALLMPLLYLNLAGLALGALWLVVVGEWRFIWIGIFVIFLSPYIIPILMIPAGIFSHFMGLYRSAQRPGRERVMFILSLAYMLLFITLWCVGIFEYVAQNVRPAALGAGLLWADTAALGSLLLWSSRDRDNGFIMTTVEVAQAAILVLTALRLAGVMDSFWFSIAVFGGIMAGAAAIQAVYEEKMAR